ncbi:MAG TPA: CHASE3 domain-containing protein, partial [Actinomycetota bacterium]|nr:CHASE3 domain-containing protein [Actinomycetota bacterium]
MTIDTGSLSTPSIERPVFLPRSGMGGLTRRMAVASALLAGVIVAAFTMLFLAVVNFTDSTDESRHTRQELVVADQLDKLILDLETGLRGYVITGEERFLAPWNDARAAFPRQAAELERLVAGDPGQVTHARELVRMGESYIQDYGVPVIQAVRRGDPSAHSVAVTEDGKRRMDALRAEFDRFAVIGRADLNQREASAGEAGRRAVIGAEVGVGSSILLILLFTGYLTRVIVRPIRAAAFMANRLATGDLSTRIPERGVGEIGTLERSFNFMADSLEQDRGELSRLAEEQGALRRVATLVARAVPPADVFSAVTREVAALLGADTAYLARYQPNGTVTVVARWSGEGTGAAGLGSTAENHAVTDRVRETRRSARLDHPAEVELGGSAPVTGAHHRSWVAAPITVGGRLWGAMVASSVRPDPLPEDAEARMTNFTDLVGTAIANSQARTDLAASRARVVSAADES